MLRRTVSGIVLMLLLTSMLSSAFIIQPLKAEQTAESPWPMFQHDPQHTGRSPFVGPKSEEPEIRVLVEGERDSDYFSPSVIGSDGTLYLGARITKVGRTKEGLYAFNPDGTEKWFYGISNPRGTPALFETENTVYILSYGSEFGGISAVDTQIGNLKWRKSFAVLYGAQNPVLDDYGILYFIAGFILPDNSYDSCLVALNKSGEAIWVYAIEKGETYFDFQLPDEGAAGFGSPGPASVVTIGIERTIYFGYEDTLFALNPDGMKKWQRTFEGERPNIPFAPVISSSGVLYVLVNGISYINYVGYCRLYALSPDGNSLWETTLAESFRSPPAIGPDGTLYVSIFWFGGRYQIWPIWYLTAVDIRGEVKWSVWGNTGLRNIIVDVEGNVFASGSYTVAGYNSNGILLWSSGVTGASLALNYDGTLFVPGKKLYAIRDLPPAPPTQPRQPINLSPADGATYVSLTPELVSSPPLQDVDPDSIPWEEIDGMEFTRVDSQWQITTIPGDYTDPVYNVTVTGGLIGRRVFPDLPEKWCNVEDPPILDLGTTYYWRVRHKDFRGVWSPWSQETSFKTPPLPPLTCVISVPDEVEVGESFDIYMGGSLGADITQVQFLIDDSQDGVPTGEWTKWYNWDSSLGDWHAETKVMKWSFDTRGEKEIWAEIKNATDNISQNHVNICASYGYAIIVAGQTAWYDWSQKRAIDHSANNAYRALRNLGFDDDHIIYLNTDSQNIDGQDVVDKSPSFDNLQDSLDEIKDNPTPLILYLVGHGIKEVFDFYTESKALSSSDLREMLEPFDDNLMLIVIGSCYSGSFITRDLLNDTISGHNRIIITATHDDEGFWGKRYSALGLGGWYHSSDRFWGNLNKGLNVKDAFVMNAWPGDRIHLWLDDNGDAKGNPPGDLKDDGELAARTTIGVPDMDDLELTSWYSVWIHSAGELRVYDSQNRVSGLVNGEVKEEIPNSIYDEENRIVAIFSPSDTYRYEVAGTETETYGLDVAFIEDGDATIFTAIDIPTSANAIHQYTIDWALLSLGQEAVTVQVDSDGDGVFEHTFTSDSELSQSEYVAAMHAINTWITDSDFNEIDGFRAVFTPYRNTELYELTATNPGQFYFNILVNNTWPEPQNMTILYSIDDSFTLKGARPIHVYADLNRTIDITANCAFSDNSITVYNLAPNDTAYVTIHLEYALKGTTWTQEEVEAWYSEHGFSATVRSITSEVVITDPKLQIPPMPSSLTFFMGVLPAIILCLGIFIALLKYVMLPTKRRK